MVVELTGSCDRTGAVEVTSERPGVQRYLRVDPDSAEAAATRFYVFPGGCVTQRFRAAAPSRLQLSNTAASELGFTTRQELRQALERRSDGRLQLDA
jgi:hypothetical protein